MSLPAVVGSTVPVAVLAVPVGVLSVHWIGCPWRLRAPNAVLVISLKMGESLQMGREKQRKQTGYIIVLALLGDGQLSWCAEL